MKPAEKSRLQGYLKKWCTSTMLVGYALYIEILKVSSVLSLTLQCENLDIVGGINALL